MRKEIDELVEWRVSKTEASGPYASVCCTADDGLAGSDTASSDACTDESGGVIGERDVAQGASRASEDGVDPSPAEPAEPRFPVLLLAKAPL